MIFARGVRFMRLKSAAVRGRASGSGMAAFSTASTVIGLGILFEVLVLLTLRYPPGDAFEPLFHGSTGNP